MKVANGSIKPLFWWTLLACGFVFATLGSRRVSSGSKPLERAIFDVLESGTSYPDIPIQVCVIREGGPRLIDAVYQSSTGDTVVGSVPIRRAYQLADSGLCRQ